MVWQPYDFKLEHLKLKLQKKGCLAETQPVPSLTSGTSPTPLSLILLLKHSHNRVLEKWKAEKALHANPCLFKSNSDHQYYPISLVLQVQESILSPGNIPKYNYTLSQKCLIKYSAHLAIITSVRGTQIEETQQIRRKTGLNSLNTRTPKGSLIRGGEILRYKGKDLNLDPQNPHKKPGVEVACSYNPRPVEADSGALALMGHTSLGESVNSRFNERPHFSKQGRKQGRETMLTSNPPSGTFTLIYTHHYYQIRKKQRKI